MLFGIDYARQAIWRKRQQEVEEAREEGRQEGYRQGYEALAAEENGHDNARDQGPASSK